MSEGALVDTVLIGDTHADLDTYRALLRREEARHGGPLPSIHVGDYGFGYFSELEELEVLRFHRTHRLHRFIRGNHDLPDIVRSAPGFLHDGAISGSVLFLGGADGGLTQANTEISTHGMEAVLKHLRRMAVKPRVVISHDAPQAAAQALRDDMAGVQIPLAGSRTRRFLSEVHRMLEPELWIFGHWHHAWVGQVGSTQFRGMGLQESFTMPLLWNPAEITSLLI